MIKAEFTAEFKAKLNRIKKVPTMNESNNLFLSIRKGDALTLVKNFKKGIKTNSLGLEKLKDGTIKRKRSLGMELPETPLYGKGDGDKNRSYINMLRLRKLKNGYKVAPSWAKHWNSDLKLEDLYTIHEFGTIIKGAYGQLIRIPARPALLKSYEQTLKDISKKDNSQMVKRAITGYINDAKTTQFKIEIDRAIKGLEQFEDFD